MDVHFENKTLVMIRSRLNVIRLTHPQSFLRSEGLRGELDHLVLTHLARGRRQFPWIQSGRGVDLNVKPFRTSVFFFYSNYAVLSMFIFEGGKVKRRARGISKVNHGREGGDLDLDRKSVV